MSPAVRDRCRHDGVDPDLRRCFAIPGRHGSVSIGPLPAQAALSVELPDGDYLTVWAEDPKNTIAADPAAWATDVVDHLTPYDLHGYSVEELDGAEAAFRS